MHITTFTTLRAAWLAAAALTFSAALSACNASAQEKKMSSSTPKDTHAAATNASGDHWKKPDDAELKSHLTRTQYEVTQHAATEAPFRNEYWNNHEPGIYVDIVSGEPLFSSLDKFESGTGWPSFTKPLDPANVTEDTDRLLGYARTEIRSAHANSHLGHLFNDGPAPLGTRYCMNSASLRFIPVDRLEAEGYGKYLPLFTQHAKAK